MGEMQHGGWPLGVNHSDTRDEIREVVLSEERRGHMKRPRKSWTRDIAGFSCFLVQRCQLWMAQCRNGTSMGLWIQRIGESPIKVNRIALLSLVYCLEIASPGC